MAPRDFSLTSRPTACHPGGGESLLQNHGEPMSTDHFTRALGSACLLLALAACGAPCLPCTSGQTRPAPVYSAPEAFRILTWEVHCLNHRFAPYETAMDHCVFNKRVCKQLIALDNAVQHVSAALIVRNESPEKIQRQLDSISRDLARVEAEIGVLPSPDLCRKSPAQMAAALESR